MQGRHRLPQRLAWLAGCVVVVDLPQLVRRHPRQHVLSLRGNAHLLVIGQSLRGAQILGHQFQGRQGLGRQVLPCLELAGIGRYGRGRLLAFLALALDAPGHLRDGHSLGMPLAIVRGTLGGGAGHDHLPPRLVRLVVVPDLPLAGRVGFVRAALLPCLDHGAIGGMQGRLAQCQVLAVERVVTGVILPGTGTEAGQGDTRVRLAGPGYSLLGQDVQEGVEVAPVNGNGQLVVSGESVRPDLPQRHHGGRQGRQGIDHGLGIEGVGQSVEDVQGRDGLATVQQVGRVDALAPAEQTCRQVHRHGGRILSHVNSSRSGGARCR